MVKSSDMQCFLRFLPALITAALVIQAAAPGRYLTSANRKVTAIERNRWPSNGAVAFSPLELVALGMEQANQNLPGVLSEPELELGSGSATATALVDFDKLGQLRGDDHSSSNWLVSKMVKGQREVSVSVDLTSGGGQLTVHPTKVSIAGVEVSGSTLDFLIQNFVTPHYPDAVINKPFALPNHMSRIEVNSSAAVAHRR